ncbi:hypothetical protein HMPREF3038_00052 [Akkermansia sp. KLE1797]|nr:hypothetical protein HMPREF3038_00052 [Akkermansia sp. KLE1797]
MARLFCFPCRGKQAGEPAADVSCPEMRIVLNLFFNSNLAGLSFN